MGRIGDHGRGKGVGVGVGVVGQHAVPSVNGQGRVLDRVEAVGEGHGRGIDTDGHRGGVAVDGAVVGQVREAVASEEAGGRRVGKAAVGIECDCSVGWLGDDGGGKRVAFGVGVVGQHAGGGVFRQRRIGNGNVSVVNGDRGSVHPDRNRGRVPVGGPVVGLVREAVGTGVSVGRRIGEAAVRR